MFFVDLLKKISFDSHQCLNLQLSTPLFTMINNDASLENSAFQGGNSTDVANVLLNFLNNILKSSSDSNKSQAPELFASLEALVVIISKIKDNAQKINDVLFRGKSVQSMNDYNDLNNLRLPINLNEYEEIRLQYIEELATTFQKQIMESINTNESCFIPGGFYKHAMLYEFNVNADGSINFIIYNTGDGLDYHEDKITFEHGIFKTKKFPGYVYQFSKDKLNTPEFKNYLMELLKAKICCYWQKLSHGDVASIAKKSNSQILYDEVLPLIIHLDGKRVDPKDLLKHVDFITGQRSGKCFEAIFHPIIKKTLQTKKNYQRFMCAYRKATILDFVTAQEQAGLLNKPIIKRQIENALTNLARRIYKNKQYFDPIEISNMEAFIAATKTKFTVIPEVVSSSVDYNKLPLLTGDIPTIMSLKITKININSKKVAIASNQHKKSQTLSLMCCKDDDVQNLIKKLEQLLNWSRDQSVDRQTSSREIISSIEKTVLTWPLEKKINLNNPEQQLQIIELLVALTNIYCQQIALQFGCKNGQNFEALFTGHISVLFSILAITLQIVDTAKSIADSVKLLINKFKMHRSLQAVQYSLFLSSGKYSYDLRLKELLLFFNKDQFFFDWIDVESIDIYGLFIQNNPEAKLILLEIFNEYVKLNYQEDYDSLNKNNSPEKDILKCIYVLVRCKYVIPDTPETKKLLKELDLLILIEKFVVGFKQRIKEGIFDGSIDGRLQFYKERNDLAEYNWKLTSSSSKGFKYDYCLVDVKKILSSQKSIDDELVQNRLLAEYGSPTSLISSVIQTYGNEIVDDKSFYITKFMHTRSSNKSQLFLTINFFEDNIDLLTQDKWKILCALNLLQPNILLQAMEQTSTAKDVLFQFLEKGLINNLKNNIPNNEAIFFIKMQIIINIYLIDANWKFKKENIDNLLELNNKITVMLLQEINSDLIKNQLYACKLLIISTLIKLTEDPEKQKLFVSDYLKIKLQANQELLAQLRNDPLWFILQEQVNVTMIDYLVANQEQTAMTCFWVLQELGLIEKSILFSNEEVIFNYPLLSYGSIIINLENGKIFQDNKTHTSIPETLLNNQNFIDLFNNKIKKAWCFIDENQSLVFEIQDGDAKYFIIEDLGDLSERYVFQKENGEQLISYQKLQQQSLICCVPKTLIDDSHLFWVKRQEDGESIKELLIVDKKTKLVISKIDFDNNVRRILTNDEQGIIHTQQQAKDSIFGKLFSKFEDSSFIEVVKFINKYIIRLPRYNLEFTVTNLNPLEIKSGPDLKDTLLLEDNYNNQANIKNALFLQKDTGEIVVIIPQQYFIAPNDDFNNLEFEYHELELDTANRTEASLLVTEKTKIHCGKCKFFKFKLDQNSKLLIAEDSSSALYLVYVYLANFNYSAAFKTLRDLERTGGLKGLDLEVNNLLLTFTSLPKPSHSVDDVSKKIINIPEFIAVKAYALYLYANFKHKKITIEKELDAKLQQHASLIIAKYLEIKNNIAKELQLTTKQELELLNLSNNNSSNSSSNNSLLPVLTLTKQKLFLEGFTQEQNLRETEAIFKYKFAEKRYQYKTKSLKQIFFTSSDQETKNQILTLMQKLNVGEHNIDLLIQQAGKLLTDNLLFNLSLEKFFTFFPIYYHIATCSDSSLESYKNLLKQFLEYKLKIIANDHQIFGKELIILLYGIIINDDKLPKPFNDLQSFFAIAQYIGKGQILNAATFYDYLVTKVGRNFYLPSFEVDYTVEKSLTNTKVIDELLSQQTSDLAKPNLQYRSPEFLNYSKSFNDLLEKYKLNLVTGDFLEKYQQLLLDAEKNIQKKRQVFSEVTLSLNFEELASRELDLEKELGKLHNNNVALQITFVNEKLTDEIIAEIFKKTNAFLEKNYQDKEDLLNKIKNILNQNQQLSFQGKFLQQLLTEQKILDLYLIKDKQSFMECSGLSEEQVIAIYDLITEYLFVAINCQQLERIKQQIVELNQLPQESPERPFALRNLANILAVNNLIGSTIDPAVLNVFQFCRNILLRQEQVNYLTEHTETTDGSYKNLISQLIMGFGKTFLLPIIAKTKATGKNLVVVEVPDALLETNFADLHNASIQFLDQKAEAFIFNRNTPCSTVNLQNLYERLVAIKHSKGYLVTTGESVASINLRYFEILNVIAHGNNRSMVFLEDLKNQAVWLEKIIKLFKFEADVIIDEVHSGLNVRKKLVYSIKSKDISQKEITTILKMYQLLLPSKVYLDYTLEDIIRNPGIVASKEEVWQEIMATCAKLMEERLESNDEQKALYKLQLTKLLPSTLKKENKKHYGLLVKDEQLLGVCYAVPFIASDTPRVLSKQNDGTIRTTTFANSEETINYTIQAYISQGIPLLMTKSILEKLKKQAKIELLIGINKTELLLKKLLKNDSDNLEFSDDLFRRLSKDPDFIFYALEYEILPTIKVDTVILEYNSNQRAYSYHSAQGISGTPNNHRSISKMSFNTVKYSGTNGITVDLIIKKNPEVQILKDSQALVEQLLNTKNSQNKHAIIDAGGLFTGVTNLHVSQKIAAYLRSNSSQKINYILFFNDNNQLSAINIHDPNNIIVIGSSDKTAIKKALKDCNENEWFTYYDQQHTEGVDIVQAATSSAAVTFSYDTTLTKFLQAAMRMRGLAKNQTLEVFMPSQIHNSCFNNKFPIEITEVILFLNNNETILLSEEHLRYILQEMDNLLYQELTQILFDAESIDEKLRIFNIVNSHSDMFLKKFGTTDTAKYDSQIDTTDNLTTILNNKKDFLIKLRTEILSNLIGTRSGHESDASNAIKLTQFEQKLTMLVNKGVEYCKSTVIYRENCDQNTEVETETELETNLELETYVAKPVASKIPMIYDNWLLRSINDILDDSKNIENFIDKLRSLHEISDLKCGFNEIYMSINHSYMYKEQLEYFDTYRMPIQMVLMIQRADGLLQTLIITPNEAQELIENKKDLFLKDSPKIWIESVPLSITIVGSRPLNIEEDLNYLKILEQIRFINGDLKHLLIQKEYLWLLQHLKIAKELLPKILRNRPDQQEYAQQLLIKIKSIDSQETSLEEMLEIITPTVRDFETAYENNDLKGMRLLITSNSSIELPEILKKKIIIWFFECGYTELLSLFVNKFISQEMLKDRNNRLDVFWYLHNITQNDLDSLFDKFVYTRSDSDTLVKIRSLFNDDDSLKEPENCLLFMNSIIYQLRKNNSVTNEDRTKILNAIINYICSSSNTLNNLACFKRGLISLFKYLLVTEQYSYLEKLIKFFEDNNSISWFNDQEKLDCVTLIANSIDDQLFNKIFDLILNKNEFKLLKTCAKNGFCSVKCFIKMFVKHKDKILQFTKDQKLELLQASYAMPLVFFDLANADLLFQTLTGEKLKSNKVEQFFIDVLNKCGSCACTPWVISYALLSSINPKFSNLIVNALFKTGNVHIIIEFLYYGCGAVKKEILNNMNNNKKIFLLLIETMLIYHIESNRDEIFKIFKLIVNQFGSDYLAENIISLINDVTNSDRKPILFSANNLRANTGIKRGKDILNPLLLHYPRLCGYILQYSKATSFSELQTLQSAFYNNTKIIFGNEAEFLDFEQKFNDAANSYLKKQWSLKNVCVIS